MNNKASLQYFSCVVLCQDLLTDMGKLARDGETGGGVGSFEMK